MNKEQLKERIKNSFPSVFTIDDVIKLIDLLEDNNSDLHFKQNDLKELSFFIAEEIRYNFSRVMRLEDATFNIKDGNKIEINNLEFKDRELYNCIKNSVIEFNDRLA